MTHTPGPWTVGRKGEQLEDYASGSNYVEAIVGVHHRIGFVEFGDPCAEANAVLIAAAPETAAERDQLLAINAELLTVARNLRNRTLDFVEAESWPEVEAVRRVIAKAEGRE